MARLLYLCYLPERSWNAVKFTAKKTCQVIPPSRRCPFIPQNSFCLLFLLLFCFLCEASSQKGKARGIPHTPIDDSTELSSPEFCYQQSQNHRISPVGVDPRGSSSPSPGSTQDHPKPKSCSHCPVNPTGGSPESSRCCMGLVAIQHLLARH